MFISVKSNTSLRFRISGILFFQNSTVRIFINTYPFLSDSLLNNDWKILKLKQISVKYERKIIQHCFELLFKMIKILSIRLYKRTKCDRNTTIFYPSFHLNMIYYVLKMY